jgi:glycosyltransferase involved in cell wall biosynthesis
MIAPAASGRGARLHAAPRVHLLYTRYSHVGEHSGAAAFIREVVQSRLPIRTSATGGGAAPGQRAPARWRKVINGRIGGEMPWYAAADLYGEVVAGAACVIGRRDVVHYFDGEHGARWLPTARRAGLISARTVATFHQPPALLDSLLDRRVITGLDHVVVVSPTQRPFFEAIVGAQRVRTIHLGVDTAFFRPGCEPRPPGPFRCITVGHWLRDWAALRSVARLALQRGVEIEMHIVTDRATGLHGLANVRRHRNLTDEQLRALYQRCDALLLPLTGATANNALLEGIACGLPAVVTRLPAVASYLGPNAQSLVDDNDSDAMLDALVSLRDDEELRGTCVRSARARAEQLSWKNVARQYIDLYAEIVSPSRAAAMFSAGRNHSAQT